MSAPHALTAETDAARYIATPVRRADIWAFYKNMVASFWTVEEVDLAKDYADFHGMPPAAQQCIRHILAFFAIADGVVVANLTDNFLQQATVFEAKFAYAAQGFMETIHSEMYSALLETIVPDSVDRASLLESATESPHIVRKTDFCKQYMSDERSFSERLIAFTVVEGVMFSSSFAFIYWLKTKALMPGLCFSNELIARDEGMHRDLGVCIYKGYCEQLPVDMVHSIVREGVRVEQNFVRTALGEGLLGLCAESMCDYVEFVADHLLDALGVPKVYNKPNPLDFMELISLQGKTNFFEKRVGEYAKPNVSADSGPADRQLTDFGDDDDF